MGTARLAIYLVGLVVIVAGIWVLLIRTPLGRTVPAGVALALILLVVGIGVMASARSINESRTTRRVSHDHAGAPGYGEPRYAVPPPPASNAVTPPAVGESETIVEEHRYDRTT